MIRASMYGGTRMMVLDTDTNSLSLYAVKDNKAPLAAMIAVGEPIQTVTIPATKAAEFIANSIVRANIRMAEAGWEKYA